MSGPIDPRLLRHARASRGGIAGLGLLGAGQAGATLLIAVALTGIVAGPRDHAIALLAAAFAARGLLSWAERVVAARTAARVTDELRRSVLAAALRRGPAWVARYGSGRLTAVLTTGLDALRPWFDGYLPALVLGVALPPLVIVAMALVDPGSALIALLTLPLIPVLGALIGWATRARAQQRWAADARLASHFLDVVRGLTTLRVYGRAERQTDVVAEMTDRHRGATMRVLRVAFLSSTALDLVGTLSVGLVAVEAGLRVAGGSLGLGPALLVILLAPEAYRPLREVAARFHASADASAVIADVDEVLSEDVDEVRPERVDQVRPERVDQVRPERVDQVRSERVDQVRSERVDATRTDADRPAEQSAPGVELLGLRVRYPGSTGDALVLRHLAVSGGELVALRGSSGAGKTTALRVLAGIQPADAGRVAVFGPAPIYLPQRPTLPHARTVADVFGDDPTLSDAELIAALRVVGLDAELTPDTALGERGLGVSAGQRQRLALAALLRRARTEPVVLLLDEPTAHLDADAERLVIAQLRAAADRGCAVLAVAHRPALLHAADTVIAITPPARATDSHRPPASTPPASASAIAPAPADDRSEDARPHLDDRLGETLPRQPGSAHLPLARPQSARQTLAWHRFARPWVAVGLGAAAWLAGVVLTGAAAWLLVRAATLPPVLTLSAAVVLVRASAVARPLLRYLERLVAHDVAFSRLGARRAAVYADLIPRVPAPRLHRRGELLTRIVNDVDAQVDGLLRGRLPARSAVVALGLAAVAAALAVPAVGVPLAAGLAVAAGLAPALAARQAARREVATGLARAQLRDAVVETVDGLEELAAPGRAGRSGAPATVSGGRARSVPEMRSQVLARLEARGARAAGMAAGVAQLGWGVTVVGAAVALSRVDGLAPEWAAVLLLGIVALGEPVAVLPDAAIARRQARSADRRLAALAAEPSTSQLSPSELSPSELSSGQPSSGQPGADGGGGQLTDGWGDVVVRGLVAGWDPAREPALRGVDLDLPLGVRLAVTGPSGGGKSTLAAVLARLLDPRAGVVTIGGRDARTLPDCLVRRRIALVSDDADHIFASTVRENLRLARPDADDRMLAAALHDVGLGDWDLGTFLGAGGSTVSGGQRRRFATARALLADPALLILDEPTEGLDQPGAEALMADLLDAAAGRTVLLLTHRTEGLDRVDRRFVLHGGRIGTLATATA